MKKVLLSVALIVACATFTTEAKKKAPEAPAATALKTDKDSVSYAFGLEFAKSINNTLSNVPGAPYDKKLVVEALSKMINDDTLNLAFPEKDANEIIQKNLKKFQEAESQKRLNEEKQFLAKNKKRPEVKETPSGLQYEILQMGNGEKPTSAESKVKVNYIGTLSDGTEFDNSYKRGEPIEFKLNGVIKGWTEGLQLMSVGSKYKFYIPYDLGYGEHGQGPIKPYSTLIFEVELLGVENANPQVIKGEKYEFQQYQRNQ